MKTLVIALLLAVVALLIAVVVVLLAAKRAARKQQDTDAATLKRAAAVDPLANPEADAMLGDPRQLKPGDVVEVRGHSYSIRGSMHCNEGSWSWTEHLLGDAQSSELYLSVEEDPDLILTLWTYVKGATISPGPATLEFDGRRYTMDEAGKAKYTSLGTTGLDPSGSMRYHDYRSADGTRLSFEQFGGSENWELSRGDLLNRHELRAYPTAP